MQDFYRGAVRVIVLLTHDFPEFFVENHMQLNSSVPENLVQMYNILNSASPSSFQELPDPFTPGLKMNRLEQVRHAPNVRGDVGSILAEAGIKDVLDKILEASGKKIEAKEDDVRQVLAGLVTTSGPDTLTINALVLHIGIVGTTKGSKTFEPSTRPAQLLENLLVSPAAAPALRYQILSAATNQLRHPNAHTFYFSSALLHLFANTPNVGAKTDEVQQQIARILVERLLTARPHPWGLIVTVLELVKNNEFNIWELSWMKASPDVERMFFGVATQGGLGGANVSIAGGATGGGSGSTTDGTATAGENSPGSVGVRGQ